MKNIRYNSFIDTNWDRILYNSKVMNFAKNKQFLRKLVYSGKVSTSQTRIPKFNVGEIGSTIINRNKFRHLYFKRLCEYIDVYQNKFGDDWDIHFHKDPNRNGYYIIYLFKIFDKVVVNNYGKKTSHTIRDLAVFNTIGMKEDGEFWIPRMKGLKLTFSIKEMLSGYVHSHLRHLSSPRADCDILQDFCIGSNSDASYLSGTLALEFSKEQFELYLYSQDSTIECESNIGAPYIRFSTILEKKTRQIDMYIKDVYREHFDKTLFLGKSIDVDYYILDNRYHIKNNDTFHSFIKNHILHHLISDDWKSLLCKRGEEGAYYSYESIERATVTDTSVPINKDYVTDTPPYIYYNGVKKEFKVAKESSIKQENKLKIEEFIVYPNLLNYIHAQLEHKLQETAVAGSNIRRHYSRSNVSSYLR